MRNLMIASLLMLNAGIASACSCALLSASDILRDSDTVILGSANYDSRPITRSVDEDDWLGATAMLTEFRVIRDYKGGAQSDVSFLSPVDLGANCGIDFKANDGVILVIGNKNPITGELVTSSCGVRWVNNTEAYELMIELEVLASISDKA